MQRTELISKIKELNIQTPRPAHQMKTVDLEEILKSSNIESSRTENRGRKINPNSARQQRLMLKQSLLESGVEVKRGRKVDESSARQQRLNQWLQKKELGIEIKRGRPKMIQVEVTA